jgi:hypothetical protein
VIPIDHIHRTATYEAAKSWATSPTTHPTDRNPTLKAPARLAHVDQSYTGAPTWLTSNLTALHPTDPTLTTRLTRTRWSIINVWRPLTPLRRDPLGVCDGSSIPDTDLQEHMLHLAGPTNSSSSSTTTRFAEGDSAPLFGMWVATYPFPPSPPLLNPNPPTHQHRWWYLSAMKPTTILAIKIFDSKKDGRCRRAVHSAFEDPRYATDDEPPRESVEVRCAVFWEDQSLE